MWHPWSPSGPPPAKRYGSDTQLASDLRGAGAGCEHPHDLWGGEAPRANDPGGDSGITYACSVAGGRLYFAVFSEEFLDEQEETLDFSWRDILTAEEATVRDVMFHVGVETTGGVVLGPNWVAFSDWNVTVEVAHDAIGGRLVLIDPPSPSARATPTS